MRLIPYQRLELDSSLSIDEAAQRIREATEPARWPSPFPSQSGHTFAGKVEGHAFAIWRIIRYGNSFLPEIRGRIEAVSGGSRISITMRLHRVTLVLMTIWLAIVASFAVDLLRRAEDSRDTLGGLAVPVAMFLFLEILSVGCFAYEAKKAEGVLVRLFDARLSRR